MVKEYKGLFFLQNTYMLMISSPYYISFFTFYTEFLKNEMQKEWELQGIVSCPKQSFV